MAPYFCSYFFKDFLLLNGETGMNLVYFVIEWLNEVKNAKIDTEKKSKLAI